MGLSLKAKRGFSLIEIILSITIFVILVSGVVVSTINSRLDSLATSRRLEAVSNTTAIYALIENQNIEILNEEKYIENIDLLKFSKEKPKNRITYTAEKTSSGKYIQLTVTATWKHPRTNKELEYKLNGLIY